MPIPPIFNDKDPFDSFLVVRGRSTGRGGGKSPKLAMLANIDPKGAQGGGGRGGRGEGPKYTDLHSDRFYQIVNEVLRGGEREKKISCPEGIISRATDRRSQQRTSK